MAAILYRYAQFKGYDVSAKADLAVYTDAESVGAYATDAMAWANGAGLITGTSTTTLSPAGNATRVQVAAILMRFCEHVAKYIIVLPERLTFGPVSLFICSYHQ